MPKGVIDLGPLHDKPPGEVCCVTESKQAKAYTTGTSVNVNHLDICNSNVRSTGAGRHRTTGGNHRGILSGSPASRKSIPGPGVLSKGMSSEKHFSLPERQKYFPTSSPPTTLPTRLF